MSTPYENFDTYQLGESWDYNDEMQILFEERVPRGPVANRPEDTAEDDLPHNALYYATDDNVLYRWDGNAGEWLISGFGESSIRIPGTLLVEALDVEGNADVGGELREQNNRVATRSYVEDQIGDTDPIQSATEMPENLDEGDIVVIY